MEWHKNMRLVAIQPKALLPKQDDDIAKPVIRPVLIYTFVLKNY